MTPSPTPAPAPAPAPDPDAGLIDVAALGPYFDDVFGGEAARALAEDRLEDAMRLFDDIARELTDSELTPRARFLAAYLAGRLGDNARALDELPGLAHQLPLIADTANERAAHAAATLGRHEQAIELARSVSAASSLAADAELLIADSLRTLERWPAAAEAYAGFRERWPASDRSAEVTSRLIECRARLVLDAEPIDEDAVRAVLELYENLRAQSPRSRWTRIAARHQQELAAAIGEQQPRRREESKAAERAYEKALELKQKMQNKQAEKAFAKVIRLARKDGELASRARLDQAIVVGRQRAHARAAALFAELADSCTDPTIRIRALYHAGKSFMAADQYSEAIEYFARVEADYADHSYADDARLHAARCHLALGDREKFVELITALPEDYPTGDMRSEALWSGAHEALRREDWPAAREILATYYDQFPLEHGWYTAGRSGYWLGRVEELLDNHTAAADRYAQVVAASPLSHYMVLAHARLRALDAERADRLIERLAPPGGEVQARFREGLLDEQPALATGIELLRLGLTNRGRREIGELLADPETSAEIHWIAAAMFRRTGQFTDARVVASRRSATDGWKQRYPSGADLVHWTLAYPTAFEEEVATAAEESGVDRALLWAVMREESGFNAMVESWANAIGLMQLIMPTARSMGQRLELKVTRKSLRQPATNIRLGAAYLAFLADKFDDHPALMIAGYNAGEGAVARWLEERPASDLDIFVEEIPYQQTRGYTKRVLSSYATYTFLYEENRPVITPALRLP